MEVLQQATTLIMLRQVASTLIRPSDLAMAMAGLFLFSCLAHRLTQKGPMHWPLFGVLPTLFLHLGDIYDWATVLLARSGGTFPYHGMWLGGAHGVITSDPANVEYILRTRFTNFPKGRYYRERFADLLGDGIFNADDDAWRTQRRAATSEMHSPRFASYSAASIASLVHGKLLVLLSRLAADGRAADLQDIFLRFTFDNICLAAFGVDPGCLAVDLPEVHFAGAFERATELTLIRFIVPPFVWKPMRRLGLGPERELREAVRVVHEFAEKTVSQRRAEFTSSGNLIDRSDLLSRLVEATEDVDVNGGVGSKKLRFSDKFIKDFCISFILAGRDTSSVALTWFFWLLHGRPDVEARVLDELYSIIENRQDINKTGSFDDVVFTVEELGRMDYLQAALSEALRLYPSVPVDFKEAVEDDVLPDGTPVRKGGRVIYSIYSMARSEGVWGKDCREFRPERWIGERGRFEGESQFKYPVFNAGPRLCVGKKFAYVQMKTLAAAVLLRFKVEVVQGQVVVPKMTTTLYMRNGLLVTFKPRQNNKV
ncbi:hypothetical protein Taro_034497 [Colocasia esculenta]|uniref:Cytochrome P450 86B1 n=1 Tax=Colocasia esculenta TaxID=4460 RepID=A0A843VXY8_COLES|nr:hypothetical protein [Colocasia esculenta]